MDRMKEELLKNKLDQFLRQALEELKEEVKEQEQEEKIIVTITEGNTSVEGTGNAFTLLNGICCLALALEEQGINTTDIVGAIELAKRRKGGENKW